MISYKTWKILQENLGYTNLGVKSANIVGSVNEAPGLFGMMKKAKKPMPGEDPGMAPDMGGADATDDDDMGGDEEDHDHDDMGDDEDGEDHDEDGDEEDHDHDEDGEDHDDMGDEGDGEEGPPPPMDKKKKPPFGGGDMGAKPPMMMKKEGKDAVDEKDKKQNSANGADMLKYKQKGKCSKCNMMAKEEKEENSFLAKLRDMTGGTKFAKDEEGYWVPVDEDTLIAPEDTNKSANTEPAPGEVGYAPTQKIGGPGSFNEWATKHVNKTRKK
jgi:hypothetical protein